MEDSALESPIQDVGTRSNEQAAGTGTGSRKGASRSRSTKETANSQPQETTPVPPADLPRLKPRARQQRPAKKRVFSLLAEVKMASQDARFVQALGAFREAVNLSQGVRSLREIAFDTAVEEAEQLLPENWRVAEALVSELALLDLDHSVPASIVARMRRAAHDEGLATILNRIKQGGDPEELRERLKRAMRLYPGEEALETHWKAMNAQLEVAPNEESPATAAPQAAPHPEVARESSGSETKQTVDASAAPSVGPEKIEPEKIAEPAAQSTLAEDISQSDLIVLVQSLLETGPLPEAQRACKDASERFPHSPALWVLANAIRDKEEEIRLLLSKGEEHLEQLNLRAAREAFLQASGLVPLDHTLRSGIADKLHARARTELEMDWRSSEALLALSDRISPGRFVPSDLAQALADRKRQVSPEAPPAAEKDSIIDVEVLAYTETVSQPRERRSRPSPASVAIVDIDAHPLRRVMKRVAAYSVLVALIASVAVVVNSWRPWERYPTRRRHVLVIPSTGTTAVRVPPPAEAVTGTLTIHSNVPGIEIFVDSKKYNQPEGKMELALNLPPAIYVVRAVRSGYEESEPIVASVLSGVNREVHIFLSPKPIAPVVSAAEARDWQLASTVKTSAALSSFIQKYPTSLHLPAAKDELQEIQWQYVDQNDPQVLQAFLSQYPTGSRSEQVRAQLQQLNSAKSPRIVEQNDWIATNKSDKAELAKYLTKYPNGSHSAQARRFITMLDRWSSAALSDARRIPGRQ